MPDLFDYASATLASKIAPLADRIRPIALEQVVGQEHLTGPGKLLHEMVTTSNVSSMIFWGPPGTGKTTLAIILARAADAEFCAYSAVLSGVKEIRQVVSEARDRLKYQGKKTILFVDEIHRFNKAQQDAFLPHVENGLLTLIGATTENPSFEINAPLLSRLKVLVLSPIGNEGILKVVDRALEDKKVGLGDQKIKLDENAREFLATQADGDCRRALNTLEVAASICAPNKAGLKCLTLEIVQQAAQKKALLYDKGGEEHYNTISAFIKSMRGSDPDAAVYWMVRMLEAGEDPLFIARRMVIFASEDISNADPRALPLAIATMEAVNFVGLPEAAINLSHCATFLASSPKSNASYKALCLAKAKVKETGSLQGPKHIRNAPTKLMEELGYGAGYQYPHDFEGHYVPENYLPEQLQGSTFYNPTDQGYEKSIKERLETWRTLRKNSKKNL
jgi:putative ATPase